MHPLSQVDIQQYFDQYLVHIQGDSKQGLSVQVNKKIYEYLSYTDYVQHGYHRVIQGIKIDFPSLIDPQRTTHSSAGHGVIYKPISTHKDANLRIYFATIQAFSSLVRFFIFAQRLSTFTK